MERRMRFDDWGAELEEVTIVEERDDEEIVLDTQTLRALYVAVMSYGVLPRGGKLPS